MFGSFFSYLILVLLTGYCIHKYYIKNGELREKTTATLKKVWLLWLCPLVLCYICLPKAAHENNGISAFSLPLYRVWGRIENILEINLLFSALILFTLVGTAGYRYYVQKEHLRERAFVFLRNLCIWYFLPLALVVLFFPRIIIKAAP